MTDKSWSLTTDQTTALANQLVTRWATDRCTIPEPPERDLARWILEWLSGPVDLRDAVELNGALNALESWTGAPT